MSSNEIYLSLCVFNDAQRTIIRLGGVIRLVRVFTLEKHSQRNNKYLPKFVQAHNASSGIRAANDTISERKGFFLNALFAILQFLTRNIECFSVQSNC